MQKLLIPVLIALGLLATTDRARADLMFAADISHAQEFPVTPDRGFFGFATFTLNDAQTEFRYSATIFGIDLDGTQTPLDPTDNLTAAHIHASPTAFPGVNAGVVFGFQGTPFNETAPNDVVVTPFATGAGYTVSGKWDLTEGNNTTLTAQLPNILGGTSYINFHTQLFTGGEIRGQIGAVPEPSTLVLGALGALGLAGYRWRRRKEAKQTLPPGEVQG